MVDLGYSYNMRPLIEFKLCCLDHSKLSIRAMQWDTDEFIQGIAMSNLQLFITPSDDAVLCVFQVNLWQGTLSVPGPRWIYVFIILSKFFQDLSKHSCVGCSLSTSIYFSNAERMSEICYLIFLAFRISNMNNEKRIIHEQALNISWFFSGTVILYIWSILFTVRKTRLCFFYVTPMLSWGYDWRWVEA